MRWPYPSVKAAEVARVMGESLQTDIPLETIVEEVKWRYHLYFLIPGGASYGGDSQVLGFWNHHIGPDRVIKLDSPEDTSESIGLTIGINEGVITLNDGVAQMQRRGVVGRTVDRISQALGSLLPTGPTVQSPRARRL